MLGVDADQPRNPNTVLELGARATMCRHGALCAVFAGTWLAPMRTWRNSMTWFFFAVIVVASFALLKVRRRRKAQQSDSSYFDSKAA
jgi:hypothetical protein